MLKDKFYTEYEMASETAENFGGRVYLYIPTTNLQNCCFVYKKRRDDRLFIKGMIVRKLECSESMCWYGFVPVEKLEEEDFRVITEGTDKEIAKTLRKLQAYVMAGIL